MANVMGYYQAPAAPMAPPVPPAPQVPQVAGAATPVAPAAPTGYQQVASWDTWKPTSNSDPYVAGMRTAAFPIFTSGKPAASRCRRSAGMKPAGSVSTV